MSVPLRTIPGMDSGAVLRDWRKRAGLSQTQLALRTGTHQSVIARIERRGVRPTVDTLDRLLRACGASLEATPAPSTMGMVDAAEMRHLLARPPLHRIASAARPPTFAPHRALHWLSAARLRYVLVGDLALLAHGCPPPSEPRAIEILIDTHEFNRTRLANALRRLGVGLPPAVERGPIPRARRVSASTRWGLVVAGRPTGFAWFPNLVAASVSVDLGTRMPLLVASLTDLIHIERSARIPSPRLMPLLALRDELSRRKPAVGSPRPRPVE